MWKSVGDLQDGDAMVPKKINKLEVKANQSQLGSYMTPTHCVSEDCTVNK